MVVLLNNFCENHDAFFQDSLINPEVQKNSIYLN